MISRGLNTGHTEESATSINLGQGGKGSPNKFTLKPTEINKYICITVVIVVTDNAFKIVEAIKILAAKSDSTGWRHVACFAHSLSFVVKAAIEKNAELSPLLTDALAIVTIFHSSHKATAKLRSLCKDRTSKVSSQDVATRWNATFIMLDLWSISNNVQYALFSKIIDRRDLMID